MSVCLVTQSCLTLCNPTNCSPPGSSVHGILQAIILEWVVTSFSWGSSRPRDWTWVSCIAGRFFISLVTREAPHIYVYMNIYIYIYIYMNREIEVHTLVFPLQKTWNKWQHYTDFRKLIHQEKIPDGQLSRISLNGWLSHQELLTDTVPQLWLQPKIKPWGGKFCNF